MSKERATRNEPEKRFSELTAAGKLKFVGKVLIFAISFGFAFPTLFSD